VIKILHEKRGLKAMEEIGIIPRYGGYVIHDCWASYLAYEHCDHGLCGSHLLRELKFIIDSNEYRWAKNIKSLLQETAAKVSSRKQKKLTIKEYAALQKRYRNILTRGEAEMPEIVRRSGKKRGRIAKSDAHNLLERMQKYEVAVLAFARVSEVSFTNNRAERDLRMAKVKQKISGCFRNAEMAQAYCRISSYLQTMAYKGYDPMIAVQMALDGRWKRVNAA
jgi:transposase